MSNEFVGIHNPAACAHKDEKGKEQTSEEKRREAAQPDSEQRLVFAWSWSFIRRVKGSVTNALHR
jgi:hypothetical protein